ncbi:MAG: threonine ammonia-lyase [Candidatus Sumerlaeaceae bacterium]
MAGNLAVNIKDIRAAAARIAPLLVPTPIASSDALCREWGCAVHFKLEMLQTTGSFKERGALNKLLLLNDKEKQCGVIAASAGNHAQALAHHANLLGVACTIVMPTNAPLIKVKNTREDGADVLLHGANYDEALAYARELSDERALTFIHGFDDDEIVAGQGTAGLEILDQCRDVDCIVVPVGGGGLLAGIAIAAKESNPSIRVIGVEAAAVPSMTAALEAGHVVTIEGKPTIANGIAVRRVGQLCLEIAQHYMDDLITVSDEEMAAAVLLLIEREKAVVEAAGAAGVAAMMNGRISGLVGKRVAVVLSGGNIDVNRLSRIIDKGLVRDARLVRLRVRVPDVPGQLSRILDLIAQQCANILDIQHERAFSTAAVGETAIDLTLETRGEEHIQELLRVIAEKNEVTRLSAG